MWGVLYTLCIYTRHPEAINFHIHIIYVARKDTMKCEYHGAVAETMRKLLYFKLSINMYIVYMARLYLFMCAILLAVPLFIAYLIYKYKFAKSIY